MKRTGQCLCGAVTYAGTVEPALSACHCGMCRRWSGGPFMAVGPADVEFSGESNLTVFKSSAWAERGFCNKCGSSIFYRLVAGPHAGTTNVALGTLDDQSGFELVREWFPDLKPDAYALKGEHQMVTSKQVAEMYGIE